MGTTSPRAMFLGLDAMRGVAAVSVMLYHFSPFLSADIILPGAYLAVDLFFVLSGFVICHAYHAKLEAGMGVSRFCAVRLIRLYPLYIAATILGLLYIVARTVLLHQAWAGPFDLLCIAVAFPVAILVGSRIEPALTPRFSALLGYLSYPVYVLHTPIALIVAGIWKVSAASDPTAAMPLSGGMMVVAVLLGSYGLTRWYDVPLRAWLTTRLLKGSGRLPVQLGTGATTPSTAAS